MDERAALNSTLAKPWGREPPKRKTKNKQKTGDVKLETAEGVGPWKLTQVRIKGRRISGTA
jgi:hypothetical protein